MQKYLTTEHINKLCLYAERNGLVFKEGEKILDAAADPKSFRSALLSLQIKIHDEETVSKTELKKMRSVPSEIVELCKLFEDKSKGQAYLESIACRIIRGIKSTAYSSIMASLNSYRHFRVAQVMSPQVAVSLPQQTSFAF